MSRLDQDGDSRVVDVVGLGPVGQEELRELVVLDDDGGRVVQEVVPSSSTKTSSGLAPASIKTFAISPKFPFTAPIKLVVSSSSAARTVRLGLQQQLHHLQIPPDRLIY